MTNTISDIKFQIENLKNNISKSNRKFYHFRSVSNFLFYFDKVNNKEDRDFITEKLNGFLIYIGNNNVENVHQSLTLFNEYLKPIGELFEKIFHFFVMIEPWILNIGIGFVFIIFWLTNSITYFLIFLFPLSLFCFYLGVKVYKRKVYAFMW
jgi:hypothetical protein